MKKELSQRILIRENEEVIEFTLQEIINKYLLKTNKNYYNLLKILRKHNFILCQKCKSLKGIEVHHIDKNRTNNKLENLIILCRLCHNKEHHKLTKVISYSSKIKNNLKEERENYILETGYIHHEINKGLRANSKKTFLFCDSCEKLKMINAFEKVCQECKNKENKNE